MRGRIGLFMYPSGVGSTTIGRASKLVSCSGFSSSSDGDGSGGGRGRGRGRGASGSPMFNFVATSPGKADSNERLDNTDNSFPSAGRGHGQGKPLPSTPFIPSFNSFVTPNPPPQSSGLGQGRGEPIQNFPEKGYEQGSQPKRPIFLKKDESTGTSSEADFIASVPRQPIGEKNLPENIVTVLTGTGRGKPEMKPVFRDRGNEENRHLRPRQVGSPSTGAGKWMTRAEKGDTAAASTAAANVRPKLSREEAVKKAVGVLSRGEVGSTDGGRRRRRGFEKDDWDDEAEDDDDCKALGLGNDADGEKFAKELGPSMMAELTEAFEEMSYDVLPDVEDEEYIEALDTNLKIELEPEYLMGDFETNPDINENPPIPLREALEKMKPFLMAYEGIESQEEWEEVMKDTMERVPLMKEIVDHYCGPDRVTAKQQHEELERVAKTIPASAPDSVKSFTDRAVLSLQSNPGWGFHRKWQYMDKLVAEFSKSYK